jgi:surfeit locus 1 family protein
MTASWSRPRLVPTIFTSVAFVVCAGLGIWQLERLQWKLGVIAFRDAALAAPAVSPPRTLAEAERMQFRRITAEGAFLHEREILRIAPGPTGGSGFEVLTPLRQADGWVIFVDRGFVPTGLKEPAKRAAGELTGAVEVTGFLRLPPRGKPSWFLPDNQPEQNFWFWIDLPAMAAADRLQDVAPFYIAADATPNPGGWPRGQGTTEPLPNDHLQYAITWFSLAVIAVVIYLLSLRRGARSDASDD